MKLKIEDLTWVLVFLK